MCITTNQMPPKHITIRVGSTHHDHEAQTIYKVAFFD